MPVQRGRRGLGHAKPPAGELRRPEGGEVLVPSHRAAALRLTPKGERTHGGSAALLTHPGRGAPERRRTAGEARRAPQGVLRLPVLRGAAPVGGGHAPRGRSAPAEDRVGTDRPFGLGVPGRAGLDRRGHRPPGTRPEAPRRQRDPHHPHPPVLVRLLRAHIKRSGTTPDGRIFRPPGAASSRTRATTRSGTRPARPARPVAAEPGVDSSLGPGSATRPELHRRPRRRRGGGHRATGPAGHRHRR
jgi:hypothetical protein